MIDLHVGPSFGSQFPLVLKPFKSKESDNARKVHDDHHQMCALAEEP
jgi:hypothetical protein